MHGQVIRVGLYGCGTYRTSELMEGGQEACPDRLKVIACLDIDRARADAAAEKYHAVACYSEQSFLAHDMDVVIISLPSYLHADAFVNAAQAGKDVYLEKPVCVNDEGREKLIAAAQRYPVRCYVGLSYRYVAPFRKVAEVLRREDAGAIHAVHHHWCDPGVDIPTDPVDRNWRYRRDHSGGQLIYHCCHALDWLRWIGDDMESVSATRFTSAGFGLDEEEELTACFTYKKSGIAVFNLSQRSHQSNQYGEVHTENLCVRYGWGHETYVKVYRTRARAADEIYEWAITEANNDPDLDRNRLQMKDFMEAWFEKKEMPITLADGIMAYDLGCAIRESCATGARVPISTITL